MDESRRKESKLDRESDDGEDKEVSPVTRVGERMVIKRGFVERREVRLEIADGVGSYGRSGSVGR